MFLIFLINIKEFKVLNWKTLIFFIFFNFSCWIAFLASSEIIKLYFFDFF